MAEAKLEIKVGAVLFSGEGDGKWLSEQLDKVLTKIPELLRVAPEPPLGKDSGASGSTSGRSGGSTGHAGTLASFLSAKNAKNDKTRKFLATASWLQESANRNRLSTADVVKAVSQHNQGSLGNASQCLNNNAKRGFVTKEGRQFYVTDEGRAELG